MTALCSILLLLPALLGAASAPDDPMIKYSTEKVRLYSDVEKERVKRVIDEIEFFNDFADDFFRSFGITHKKSNPIRIYLYAGLQDFEESAFRERVVRQSDNAYFSMSNNRIVSSYGDGSQKALAGLMHEVSRQIVRRYFNAPPAWFGEGLASYLEGMEFDPHGNLITSCGEFARISAIRYRIERLDLIEWERFFDERTTYYNFSEHGANAITWSFSAQSWGVFFFYLHHPDESARVLFSKFMKGMNTGRERSKLIMNDLLKREEEFYAFFDRGHEEIHNLYMKARDLAASRRYSDAVKRLKSILKIDARNRAAMRLAGEAAFDGEKYSTSLMFWRMLAEEDPKNTDYTWRICRCLAEVGLRGKNAITLEEAVTAGKQAVKGSRSQDPDCLAALAMAYHASGKLQDALAFMRKATRLGGPSYDEYKEMEKAYSRELVEIYKKD